MSPLRIFSVALGVLALFSTRAALAQDLVCSDFCLTCSAPCSAVKKGISKVIKIPFSGYVAKQVCKKLLGAECQEACRSEVCGDELSPEDVIPYFTPQEAGGDCECYWNQSRPCPHGDGFQVCSGCIWPHMCVAEAPEFECPCGPGLICPPDTMACAPAPPCELSDDDNTCLFDDQWCQPLSGVCMSCSGDCPSQHQDVCETQCGAEPALCPGDFASGLYCGGQGQDSGSLYFCSLDQYTLVDDCDGFGCQRNAQGVDDQCVLDTCAPEHYEQTCDNNDRVIWRDACGVLGEVVEDCGAQVKRCRASGSTATCECIQADMFLACSGTKIVWQNSCREFRSVFMDCAGSGQVCEDHDGNAVCVNGDPDAPDPSDDPGCLASTFWSVTSASDTDSTGQQVDGTIDTAIRMEVREAVGGGLEFRVCKPGGTFIENIFVGIHDGTGSPAHRTISELPTAGKTCSDWMGLLDDTGYSEGQHFGGVWKVVSPATSAADWPGGNSTCGIVGSPTGTCWRGLNITLTRTCKQ